MSGYLRISIVLCILFGVLGFTVIPSAAAPQVVFTSPPNGAVGVRPNLDHVIIRFDRPVRLGEGCCWNASPNWQNPEIIPWYEDEIHIIRHGFDPPDLEFGSTYHFALNPDGSGSSCFADLQGNLLPKFELTFTVRQNPGDPPIEPQVVATDPPTGATNVDPNFSSISVTFNKPMAENARATGEGFGGGSASWSPDMRAWTFYRNSAGTALSPGTTVILILNPDYSVKFDDTAGNVLEETTVWFTVQGDKEAHWENSFDLKIIRVDADPAKGFFWPYYLSVPNKAQETTVLLVGPNNSGWPAFDQVWHDYKAKQDLYWLASFAWKLNLPILVPTFPRPPNAYLQSLEGAAFWPELPAELQRIDLQLVAMIADAREKLAATGISIQERVFMTGFSASGAFTSNFTVLHPEVVKASASGGIGWRCTPVSSWGEIQRMTYPMGIANLEELTGAPFNLDAFRGVPQYLYAGDQDTVGYVPYDALEPDDRTNFKQLIGEPNASLQEALLNAWALDREIYESVGTASEFALYSGVGHHYTEEILADLRSFFRRHLIPYPNSTFLGSGFSLSGSDTTAEFFGGVTADSGESFGNQFSTADTIQVLMSIGPDFNDVGWPGAIYILGSLNGTCFCKCENGTWTQWDGSLNGLVKSYQTDNLATVESVNVLQGPLLGLAGAVFNFLIAYENSSGEIYFHWPPLSFTVTP